jgi:tetratricopeptide (TPR) repeat protein
LKSKAETMSDSSTEEEKVAAIGGTTRWTRRALLGAVCSLVIGIYAWSAHSGIFELLGSGAKDSYYNLLVRGFREGRLNLKREAPPSLAQPGAPANLVWWDGVSAGLADLSYYKGKLYLYFGVTPALLLFWPYAALTGHYLLQKDAVVIFLSVGFLTGMGLVCAAWWRYFRKTGFWVVVAGALALGLANCAPAILGRCDVYEVAISGGYALTMLALAGVWGALQNPRRRLCWLAAASLAYGLALGARPSLLFGAVILLVPVAQAWREKRPLRPLLLAGGGPILAVGLGLMVYNALRFDNPLEFGQNYQLPLHTHQLFSPRYVWFNFRLGFLEWARWNWRPPFVHDIAPPPQPPGYWQVEHPFGVLTNIPLVWLALAAPLAWRSRSAEARSLLRWLLGAAALLFGVCALTLCFHDSMCLRYELEYASPLMLLAVIGILAVERAMAGQPAWRRAARCGWGLLLAFSVVFNLLASFDLQEEVHFGLGNVLLQRGNVDEAITQYQKALQIEPDYAEAHDNLGTLFVRMGRVEEGIAQFQKALRIQPDYAGAHDNLGAALLQTGKVDEAIAQFQKALQTMPESAGAYCNLGAALLQKGKVEEAISQFQMALQIDPDHAEAHNNLGNALARLGKADEAIAHLQKALQFQPDYAEAHDNLGSALLQKGREDQAITEYQMALQIKPDYADAHNNLGTALLRKGGVDEAITEYQMALQIKPGSADAHNNLGTALLRKGRVEEAITEYQKALQTKPDLAEAHDNLGKALLQKGKVDDAIAHFQRSLQINPDDAEAHYDLGNALVLTGRVDDAIAHFQRSLQIKPDDAETRNNLGWLLLQHARVEEAISQFQTALQINPDLAQARYNLGKALLQTSRMDQAVIQYQKALQIQPANPTFQISLAWLLATGPEASLRDGAKAVELARQADKLTGGQNPIILRTLAAACAEAGRFPEAVETAQRALSLAEAQSDKESAVALESELKLYQAGSAFHSPKQTQ